MMVKRLEEPVGMVELLVKIVVVEDDRNYIDGRYVEMRWQHEDEDLE